MFNTDQIAHVTHEANRVIQHLTGDPDPSPAWAEAPLWQQDSSVEGVRAALDGATPEQSHEGWAASRLADGWTYAPVKDVEAKTHPCLVPYHQLPAFQRAKDRLFVGIVRALAAEAPPADTEPALEVVVPAAVEEPARPPAPADPMRPTVGRVVHYQSYGTPGGEYLPEPRAAIVTAVRPSGTVDLAVLNPTGLHFNQGANGDGVYRSGSGEPLPGCWNWPPRT
ncbi:RyR domain-containing protein [Rhodococcus maanshanensis]|uniref:RyR domain-containing protein n=1 Tax=Rhodococcus maanshanensis TaxID=183556 RepID=UPI0022B44ECF|nr:RyR domain-containing protein [Rhodococcus maanshanensis]MCZ4557956.1 RyR domain-containing protein [Rhodococcus maanshanensis]